MGEPIYFTKIEYVESIMLERKRIILNLVSRELSLQVFKYEKQMPAIRGTRSEEVHGKIFTYDSNIPAKIIRTGKNNFKPMLIKDDIWVQKTIFSYGMMLSDEQMAEIYSLCNALDFEPFRGQKMSMNDEGYIGYRDEIRMHFHAVTDSYIPYLELPMSYYYDEEHEWPSEKLYRHLIENVLSKESKVSKWLTGYGAGSLFC